SEENILATVETFDQAFGSDPLKADYLAFGQTAKAYVDTVDDAKFYTSMGLMQFNIQVKERNIAPGSYERSAVMKKCETALRLCQVPDSMVRPNEIAGMFWVLKLDRSTPGANESDPRSFASDEIPADWFGGNLTYGALRVLVPCIKRVSK